MVQRVSTVAFEGIEARTVDVQVQVAPGLPAFYVVGLADKAVSEARERASPSRIGLGALRGSGVTRRGSGAPDRRGFGRIAVTGPWYGARALAGDTCIWLSPYRHR